MQSFEDIQKVVNEDFIEKAADLLRGMYEARQAALQRFSAEEEAEFDVIL